MGPEKLSLLAEVKNFIDERDGNTYLADLQNHLKEEKGSELSVTTVGRWVRDHLGSSFKKCKKVTPDITKVAFLEHQASVSSALRDALEDDFLVVYFDETSFTRNDGVAYGFAPKGKAPVFLHNKPAYSVGGIAAISSMGLEAFQLRDGKTNKYSTLHFFLFLVRKLRRNHPHRAHKVLLYLDNATYHTTGDVLQLLQLLRVSYIFAPAYLSPLNPIEGFFSVLKAKLKHHKVVKK